MAFWQVKYQRGRDVAREDDIRCKVSGIVFFFQNPQNQESEFLGAVEGGNFQKDQKKKQTCSLKFRAIFENFEKEQKKNRRFQFGGAAEGGKFWGPLKVENFGAVENGKFRDR